MYFCYVLLIFDATHKLEVCLLRGFWFVILDCHTRRALVLNFPSVSLTSLSCAHLRVSGSPPLFVKRWTSLAVWWAVS